jgi:Ca2+-binding EF-hand superfamily protein
LARRAPANQPGKKAAAKPAAKPAGKAAATHKPRKPVGQGAAAASPAAAKAKRDGRPLRSMDANHDGRVTKAEYMAPARKRFSAADKNRDGVVSPLEAAEAKAKKQRAEERRDKKRIAQGKEPRYRRKSDRPPRPYLSTFDANKDGRVSQKEYLARREKKFAEMDANHDGVISKEEAFAAKRLAKERREERAAKAKERRLRKVEEAKRESGASSPGPELTAPVAPPPAQKTAPAGEKGQQAPVVKPVPEGQAPQQDLPLTPIAPDVPAKAEPAT